MTPSQPRRAAFICCGQTFMSLDAGTPPCPMKLSPPHARFWERLDHDKPVSSASPRGHIEAIYERLAEGIDQAGTDGESLFLARLCLLLGAELGDVRGLQMQ